MQLILYYDYTLVHLKTYLVSEETVLILGKIKSWIELFLKD